MITAALLASLSTPAMAMPPAGTIPGKRLAINLKGTANMYTDTVPDIDGDGIDDDAICFETDLFDLKTGLHIGTGIDCLSEIIEVDTGLSLVGTATFNFTGGSQLVTRADVTVQPTTHGSPGFTHVTGSGPSGFGDVLSGTRRYASATGDSRLSGLVDMSAFDGTEGSPITFDCIFVVELD